MPGVCHFSIDPDELHVWALGALQYFLGSVLVLLTHEILPGCPEENVSEVWRMICAYYHDHGTPTQYTNFNLKTFLNEKKPLASFPCLRGRDAEAKDLLAPVADVWRKKSRDHPNHGAVLRMMEAMLEVQRILHDTANELFVPLDECARIETLVDVFLLEYQKLAYAADMDKKWLWSNRVNSAFCGTGAAE